MIYGTPQTTKLSTRLSETFKSISRSKMLNLTIVLTKTRTYRTKDFLKKVMRPMRVVTDLSTTKRTT